MVLQSRFATLPAILSVCLGTFAFALPTSAQDLRSLSLEDLHEREVIGEVLIDDTHGYVYFERVNPIGSWGAPLPYVNSRVLADARKTIFRVSLDGGDVEPMFLQNDGAGYFFSGPNPWSPDNRFIAFYRLLDGDLSVGVFDTNRLEHRLFDVDAHYARSSLAWVSDETIIFSVSNIDAADFPVVAGTRAYAEAHEHVWRDGEVSVEVATAGRFTELPQIGDAISLVEINVRTGDRRMIGLEGMEAKRIRGILAPSVPNDFIALTYDGVSENDVADMPLNAEFDVLREVAVLNRTSRQLFEIEAFKADAISWSGSGRYLLLRSTRLPEWWSTTLRLDLEDYRVSVYSVFDTASMTVVGTLPEGAGRPMWIGENLVYERSESGSGRDPNPADISFIAAESPPIAPASNGYLVLQDGDLVRVGFDGSREEVSVSIVGDLQVAMNTSPWRRHAAGLGYLSVVRSDIGLSHLVFEAETDGVKRYFQFSNDASEVWPIEVAREGSEMVAVTSAGVVLLSQADEREGVLTYEPSDEGAAAISLHSFNQHLVGIQKAVGPIPVSHTGYDGRTVTSWLFLPPGAETDGSVRYPLVVSAYAGEVHKQNPRSNSRFLGWSSVGAETITSLELLAAKGYAVLYPSIPLPAITDGASDPMIDMMSAILTSLDAALETGLVDAERLALSGQSFGGYTTLSVAVQTDRFDVLIGQAVVSNFTSGYGVFAPSSRFADQSGSAPGAPQTSLFDAGQTRMASPPWSAPERYVRNSPLFFADQVETPLMIIQGDLDETTHATQAEEMFTALRRAEKDVVFVRYFGEHHVIHHPQNQRDMWERVFSFLRDNGVTPGPKKVH